MKILVAIDHSNFSDVVSTAVLGQFRPEDTEVRVLHVLQPIAPAPPQMAPGYAPELEAQKSRPVNWLSESGSKCAVQDSRWLRRSRWATSERK